MSYIVLNGKNSNTINGMIVLSLPPISKPKKRVQYSEVDGRNGDSSTFLGYSAYDKQIEIGLHSLYDIDDVISYFDSEGIVTFSNEPDKFYIYKIIDQIDFERLLRFKKAKVKFHVQPFKYSNVENIKGYDFNLLSCYEHEEENNGFTLYVSNDNTIQLKGSSESATDFYIPVRNVSLDETGNYKLTVNASGTGTNHVFVRLIHNTPANSNSFGGRYINLSNGSVSINSSLRDPKEYNYLYIRVLPNASVDVSASVMLEYEDKIAVITNIGNVESKPCLTIYGSGQIGIALNGFYILVINLGDEQYITIDAEQLEAYKGDILKNRLVVGDYEDLSLQIGKNVMMFFGNVTKFDIVNFSRWI